MRNLADVLDDTPLPDPDVLWIRARIAAREAAELQALRTSTRRQALRYGLPVASMAWFVLEGIRTAGINPEAWIRPVTEGLGVPVSPSIWFLVPMGAAAFSAGIALALRPWLTRFFLRFSLSFISEQGLSKPDTIAGRN